MGLFGVLASFEAFVVGLGAFLVFVPKTIQNDHQWFFVKYLRLGAGSRGDLQTGFRLLAQTNWERGSVCCSRATSSLKKLNSFLLFVWLWRF
jgi:hypothetical protein